MKTCFSRLIPVALLFIVIACLIPVLSCRDAGARTEGRRWALVVGIDNYMYDVTPLRCAVSDAVNFRQALIDAAGFDQDDVFLLASTEKGNRLPTKLNIIKWISYIREKAGPEDSLILFFSGHGMDMDKESYIITYDADPSTKETLDISSLKVSDLKRIIEELPLKKILFFVDACRNDPRSGKGGGDNTLTMNQSKSLTISRGESSAPKESANFSLTFFSCKVNQRSYEWAEKQMGFFTYYLVEGLTGQARDASGNVTIGSLKRYLGSKVPQAVERERGKEMSQEPWVRGDSSIGADGWIITNATALASLKRSPISATPGAETTTPLSPALTTPSQTEPLLQEKPLLEQAQEALNAGNFAEPPGTSAIDLARQLLAMEPGNAWARSIETKAREAYEKQAMSAFEKNEFPAALDRFDRLHTLFPDNPQYQEIKILENGIGEWTSYANLFIFSARGRATVRRDGTCTFIEDGKAPDEGTWTVKDLKERAFHCQFRSGMWADLKMSADGKKLEGRLHNGARVIMNKVETK